MSAQQKKAAIHFEWPLPKNSVHKEQSIGKTLIIIYRTKQNYSITATILHQ